MSEADTTHTDIIPITVEDLVELGEMQRYLRENPSITNLELFHWQLKRQGLSEDEYDAIVQWPDGQRYNPSRRDSHECD